MIIDHQSSRRIFIRYSGLAGLGTLMFDSCKIDKRQITILMVCDWQDVNIGDIAHTPGLLHILNKFIPQAKIILWKRSRGK